MRRCFTCSLCGTNDCPNVQYETADEKWGYGIADDMGLKKIKCKDCHYNTGKCKDCLAQYYPELCERKEVEK